MRPTASKPATVNPFVDQVSRFICYPWFLLAHGVRSCGAEHIPRSGPAIIAANHQSFYDPIIISLTVNRRVIYLAWEKYMRYPLLGFLMRGFGAIGVDVNRPGPSAYGRMVNALRQGSLCGVFPEGGRTTDGLPEPPQPGIAALVLRTGAPVIPVTILGAYRCWPAGYSLPRPGPIQVLFQKPLMFDKFLHKSGRKDPELRRRIALEVMLKIAEGFAHLGAPRMAAAARRKLSATRGGTQ